MKSKWIFGVALAFFVACSDDEPCITGEVQFKNLEDLGCVNTPFQMTVTTDQEFELIRSQEDFDARIGGTCRPDIDWQGYDLIAGMKGLTNGIASIEKSLVKDCLNNRLVLRITFNLNATTIAPMVSFHALIPKIGNNEIIFVELIEKP